VQYAVFLTKTYLEKAGTVNWVKALPENELAQGNRRVVKIGEQAILFIHHANQIHAVANACPHIKLPLKGGEITEDGAIVCPWHHSAFDLRSGDVKVWTPWPPGIGPLLGKISQPKALTVFPTRVQEGSIWVALPES
jgi:nitrite reductase/ring-hydroxylating ferredoxin subunit